MLRKAIYVGLRSFIKDPYTLCDSGSSVFAASRGKRSVDV
uniref:Uncharacterized protein n=1 Tax=Rhizophora mucronata TaxID=61149 RepID=A0A2P2N9B0_RHIMU